MLNPETICNMMINEQLDPVVQFVYIICILVKQSQATLRIGKTTNQSNNLPHFEILLAQNIYVIEKF